MRNINNTLKSKVLWLFKEKILTMAFSGQPKAARFLHSQKNAPLLAAADAVVSYTKYNLSSIMYICTKK